MRGVGSLKRAREVPQGQAFPYLTGLGAQRVIEVVGQQVAPAVTASAIAYTHLNSTWQALLVCVSMLAVGTLLRSSRYPLHLIPLASAMLYLLAPPLGAALAVGISAFDSYAVRNISASEMVSPVLGAWVVTALGAFLNGRFRRDREVRVAVIGSHEFTRGFEAELSAVGVRGYGVIGCIDPEHACVQEAVAGVPCLGSLADLREILTSNAIELLVLGPLAQGAAEHDEFQAGGVSRLDVFEQVADACLDLPVSMIDAGQLYEEVFGHVPLGTTTSAWFQYLLHPRYRASWPISKRMLDLGVGAVAALLAAPVLLVSALAIKLTDWGPVLYRQPRIGERGRELELLKLRTLDKSFDQLPAEARESEEDLVTPVGRLLRRLHVNELPQIWQVLRGEMSLVGPRPEIPRIVASLESRFTYYDRRHLLKPGITGWAQVRCGYSGTPVGEAWKLCHDLYYLKRRSAMFDLLIMLQTLSTVVIPDPINRPDERFIVGARSEELPALERAALR